MRIYKGSEITLRLYNPCKIEDGLVDVVLYTTNPKLAYKIKDATVEGNIVYVKIDKFTFNNMEDGVINYIILDEVYNTERQSSYYLKTPDDYIAKSVQSSKNIDIVDNGDYKILPDEDYTSIEEVNVHVEFDAEHYYQEGYETGKAYQKSKLESVSITENGTYTREDGYNEIHVDVPDLNGSYDEGYDAGDIDGYNRGYDEGETEQKAKLTGITITENGTYSREDGYNEVVVEVPDLNGSYDEGYQAGIEDGTANAGEIIGETARVLNITENGTYTSEYSQWVDYSKPEQVTGVFDDGKEFYNEAYPQGIVYRTNDFIITPQTKVELWLKPVNYNWTTDYFSLDVREIGNDFKLRVYGVGSTKNSFEAKIGNSFVYIDLTELEYKKMHHIVMSFVDGFWLDGVKVGDFEGDFTIKNSSYSFKINPSAANIGGASNYGMFKIDDVVIIPTEDGFLNVNTNELLTYTNVKIEPQYTYYNNFTEPVAEGNLIRTVNVEVQPKIDVAATGLRFGYSTFTEVPSWADFSNTTDMSGLFNSCSKLQSFPQIDTSNVIKMTNLFYGCSSLQTIPQIDTSKVTIMESLFAQCTSLITIPQLDTRSVQNMHQMFYYCTSLTSIPPLKADKLNMPETYRGIFGYSELTKLTDFGGLIGLKCRLIGDYNFIKTPNLTYQSCINILNGLYDFTGNGETPTSNQGQLRVHPNFLTTVGDEVSIGVQKGWSITD